MEIITYPSVKDIASIWHSYFKEKPTIFNDYELACLIEDSLFGHGVTDVAVLVFVEQDQVTGILPISYEETKKSWIYYPSYIFISTDVTINKECWKFLPDLLPKPFIIYESSVKTAQTLSKLKIPWLTLYEANAIDLTEYTYSDTPFNTYLSSLNKKVRSRFRNCLNRNADLRIEVSRRYNPIEGFDLKENYLKYCNKFENGQDFNYFKNQLQLFHSIFTKADTLDQLIILKIYENDTLIAMNYSILNDEYLYDYICYRDTSSELDKRSLGTYAILQNIQWLLENQKDTTLIYDLASEFTYKKQFIPLDNKTQYIKQIFD